MSAITLVFPHQLFLFSQHPALQEKGGKDRPVWLVEDYLYFRHLDFHIQKIILHRATMQLYAASLRAHGYTVHYVESHDLPARTSLGAHLHKAHVREIHLVDPVDTWLERDLDAACAESKEYTVEKIVYESPMFLTSRADIQTVLGSKKRPFMKVFYEWQRNHLDVLMEDNKKEVRGKKVPVGGAYSFDTENRKKLPKGYVPPTIKPLHRTKESIVALAEASTYAHTHFPRTYGTEEYVDGVFSYALTRTEALAVLHDFVSHRLADFGPYEDAISTEHSIIAHSVLSPYLNIGLLTPRECVDAALKAYGKGTAPLASVEGFVRQIIGWREFIRAMYILHGTRMRMGNFFNHTNKLPKSWWNGTTGIPPVDTTIRRTLATAYSHHIERLMVAGGRMVLDEVDPNDSYRWFMEMYIDAYDWVMVPNVYGMSQFADGGIFATKPYISGSNYIIKMSDYKKGDWSIEWDALFWKFLHKHRDFFMKNPRMRMLLAAKKK